jgi:hypothetical protein
MGKVLAESLKCFCVTHQIMPKKSVKGRTRSGSEVLAVRINRELANQFKAYCVRNGLDKAEVIENLVFAWLLRKEKGILDGDLMKELFDLELHRPLTLPPTLLPSEAASGEKRYTCPTCRSNDTKLTNEALWCNTCKRIITPSWELKLREYRS